MPVSAPRSVIKLKKVLPSAHKELLRICKVLEKHFRDVQDFEFTIEEKKVYMLQPATANVPASPQFASPARWLRKN